jgi:AcrR family transcriptional regulator
MTSAEREADRRQRLLDAGLDVFGRDGYAASTIDGICRRAGVTARNFYDHFDGREALLVAVYDEIIAAARARVLAAIQPPQEGLELIRAGVVAFVGALLDDERKARLNFVEMVGVSPQAEGHRRDVLHEFRDIIIAAADGLARRGEIPARDYRLTAMALVGATQELLVDWVATPDDRAPKERVVEELVRLFAAATGLRSEPVTAS